MSFDEKIRGNVLRSDTADAVTLTENPATEWPGNFDEARQSHTTTTPVSEESRDWVMSHVRTGKDTMRVEGQAAGLEFVEDVRIHEFGEDCLLRFRKLTTPSTPAEQESVR